MIFVSVVVDIPTRALLAPFDYAVEDRLLTTEKVRQDPARYLIGMTVLVPFSGRRAVGYVIDVHREPPEGLALNKIKSIDAILAPPAFDERSAQLALWIAEKYACPVCEAVRLFLAPGQTVKVKKVEDGSWELVQRSAGPLDVRWVGLTDQAVSFKPRPQASKQRGVLWALSDGAMRLVELNALLPGASQAVKTLEKYGVVQVWNRREFRSLETTTLSSARSVRPEHLTQGQQQALKAIQEVCAAAQGDVVLLDGVTSSGKTEVYLEAIEQALREGKGAIVLVPEIALTAQTVGRFRSRFGEQVALLHSRLSVGERFDQWDLVRQGKARVVVGARSALFAPVHNLGLVIIDEEHETSYKQDSAPRYHAREVAAQLVKLNHAALVLGSATPSLESLTRCEQGTFNGVRWTRVPMPERPGRATLPEVHIVDMRQEFTSGHRSIFSKRLQDALLSTVEHHHKAVLLLNRRGFANFLMCRECGCVPQCPHCNTALTYHERTHSLVCHSCGRSWPIRAYPDPTTRCPNCGSRYLAQFGVGTQRVEDELKNLLPDTLIIRMDADTTKGKGDHRRLLEEFDAAPTAVLIGTQMIAKGLDFPEVTLVGVINADTTLKLPDFRASERTYDLLEQVAGRAGRGEEAGQVIIQTYWATDPAIQAVKTHDRRSYVASELEERREANYPPYTRLTNVLVWGKYKNQVTQVINTIASEVRKKLSGRSGWYVLGPAGCVKSKIQDRYRMHIIVKSPLDAEVGQLIAPIVNDLKKPRGVNVAIDVDAYDLM